MTELRIGVIGSGGRGRLARHAHQPGAGARIVACCDRSAATLEQNRAWYGDGIFTTDDHRALLAQPLDAVFVCTPDYLHEEHALAALGAVEFSHGPPCLAPEPVPGSENWGGRQRVFGSPWNYGSRIVPSQVVVIVAKALGLHSSNPPTRFDALEPRA